MAAKKKRSVRKSNGSNGAPDGFIKVEGAHISGFWVPEIAGQAIRGMVGDFVTKVGVDGKPNTYCILTLTSDDLSGNFIGQDPESKRRRKVEVGAGMVVGVGGAVLLSRLKGREGREVFIRFEGLGPKVTGKNQARMYDVYERGRG